MFIDILSFMRSWLCYIQVPMSIFDHHGASPPDTLHSVSDVAQAQRASALYQPQHQLGVAAVLLETDIVQSATPWSRRT